MSIIPFIVLAIIFTVLIVLCFYRLYILDGKCHAHHCMTKKPEPEPEPFDEEAFRERVRYWRAYMEGKVK